MKKSVIWILVTITLIFASFVGGVYVGRNFSHADIHVISPTSNTPTTSSSSTSQPTGGDSSNDGNTTPIPSSTAPIYPININTATVQQLDLLPEIGPVLAQRIVAWREANGAFIIAEDLLAVEGIGLTRLEEIRDFITIQEAP